MTPVTWVGEYEKWVNKNTNIRFVGGLTKQKPRWVIDRMIFYSGVNMICAPQGGRKTLLALAMARSIALPIAENFQFLGRWVAQHFRTSVPKSMDGLIHPDYYYTAHDIPILYVDRENPESVIAERLEKTGLLGCRDFFYWGNSDETNPTPEPDDPRLLEFARAGGLIIFDSLQDWYGGADENNNSQMASLMQKFTSLARLGAGVIILHHTPVQKKDQAEKLWRGATAIVAATEMAISLTKTTIEGDPAGANIFRLGEIRFRPCAKWELDFQIKWDDREIKLSPVGDNNAAQVEQQRAKIRADMAAGKKLEKATARYESALALEGVIKEDPGISITKLYEETGINRNNITELVKLRGWDEKERRMGAGQRWDKTPSRRYEVAV